MTNPIPSTVFDRAREQVPAFLESRGRVVISGGPRSGKTTLASHCEAIGLPVYHSDILIHLGWSEASEEIARTWLADPNAWICEGVTMVRAVRKRLAMDPGRPCDLFVWANTARVRRTPGQEAMAKGAASIYAGIRAELLRRGVAIHEVP